MKKRKIALLALSLGLVVNTIGCGENSSGKETETEAIITESEITVETSMEVMTETETLIETSFETETEVSETMTESTEENAEASCEESSKAEKKKKKKAKAKKEKEKKSTKLSKEKGLASHKIVGKYQGSQNVDPNTALLIGTAKDGKEFTGFIDKDGELTIMEGYKAIFLLSENRFFVPLNDSDPYCKKNDYFPMQGKIIDRNGKVIFEDPTLRFVPTNNKRLLAFSVTEEASEVTVKVGVMDDHGRWVISPGYKKKWSKLLNPKKVTLYDDGTWSFKESFLNTYYFTYKNSLVYIIRDSYLNKNRDKWIDARYYIYDSRNDTFHTDTIDTNDFSTMIFPYADDMFVHPHRHYIEIFDYEHNSVVDTAEPSIPSYGFYDNGVLSTNYFMDSYHGVIRDYSKEKKIRISKALHPYLTDEVNFMGDGFLCFLRDGDEYSYVKLDMHGEAVTKPIKLPVKVDDCYPHKYELNLVFRHVYKDRMVINSQYENTLYIIDIASGEILTRLDYSESFRYINEVYYINDNCFLLYGAREDMTPAYLFMNLDGKILNEI